MQKFGRLRIGVVGRQRDNKSALAGSCIPAGDEGRGLVRLLHRENYPGRAVPLIAPATRAQFFLPPMPRGPMGPVRRLGVEDTPPAFGCLGIDPIHILDHEVAHVSPELMQIALRALGDPIRMVGAHAPESTRFRRVLRAGFLGWRGGGADVKGKAEELKACRTVECVVDGLLSK